MIKNFVKVQRRVCCHSKRFPAASTLPTTAQFKRSSFFTNVQRFSAAEQVPSPLRTSEWYIDLTNSTPSTSRNEIDTLLSKIKYEHLATGDEMKVALVLAPESPVSNLSNYAKILFEEWNMPNHSMVIVINQTKNDVGVYIMDEAQSKTGIPLPPLFDGIWFSDLKNKILPVLASGEHDKAALIILQSIFIKLKTQYSAVSDQWKESRKELEKNSSARERYNQKTALGGSIRDISLFFAALGALGYLVYWYFFATQTCPDCNAFSLKYVKGIQNSNYKDYLDQNKQLKPLVSEENIKELELDSCYLEHYKCSRCQYEKVSRKINDLSPYRQCSKCDTRSVSTTEKTVTAPANKRSGISEITTECKYCGDKKVREKILTA